MKWEAPSMLRRGNTVYFFVKTNNPRSTFHLNVLASHGIRSSLSRPANCWDNAVAESFFSTLKLDLLYRRSWPTRAAARSAIFEYIEVFYNRE
jgi:transposase InsO family protein